MDLDLFNRANALAAEIEKAKNGLKKVIEFGRPTRVGFNQMSVDISPPIGDKVYEILRVELEAEIERLETEFQNL